MTLIGWISKKRKVIITGAFATATYLVTNVWKADIETLVDDYSQQSKRILEAQERLDDLPLFQTYSHYWAKLLDLNRMEVKIFNKTIAQKNPEPFHVIDAEDIGENGENAHRTSVLQHSTAFIRDLMADLRPDVQTISMAEKKYRFFQYAGFMSQEWWQKVTTDGLMTCMTSASGYDWPDGDKYSQALAGFYKKRADAVPEFQEPALPPTTDMQELTKAMESVTFKPFSTLIDNHLKRIEVNMSAMREVGKSHIFDDVEGISSPKLNPFDKDYNDKNNDLANRRNWSYLCLDASNEWVLDDISNILRTARAQIYSDYIAPLNARKRIIERVETVLYIASAIGAFLVGNDDGSGNKPEPTRRGRPTLNFRKRKSR